MRYRTTRSDDAGLRQRIRTITQRSRSGYQRLHVLLKREGYLVNHKLFRLYWEENETLFTSLSHARVTLGCWQTDYNDARPPSKLGWKTPVRVRLHLPSAPTSGATLCRRLGASSRRYLRIPPVRAALR
jgi:hypothetical protein